MFNIKQFVRDISSVTKTRKFWIGMLGAVVNALAVYVFGQPEFSPLLGFLTALGVYQVPNSK